MGRMRSNVAGAVLLLVIAAGVLGWLAAGAEHRTAASTARQTQTSIAQSLALAESASQLAKQLTDAVDALVIGTASAGESMTYTIAISQHVRSVLDVVAGSDNLGAGAELLTAANGGLADAEASLLETQGGLGEANTALTTAQTQLVSVTAGIDTVTASLRTAQVSGSDAVSDIDRQYVLWRVTLVLAVLAASGIVILLDRSMTRA